MARAQARGGGGGGWAVATVMLGVLFFFSLLLAIIFFTRTGDAVLRADQAQKDLATFISGQERNAPEIQVMERNATGGKSVVSQLREQNRQLRLLVAAGGPTLPDIRAQMTTLSLSKDTPLFQVIKSFKANTVADKQYIRDLEKSRDEAKAQVVRVEGEKSDLDNEYALKVDQLKNELSKLQRSYDQSQQGHRDQIATLGDHLKSVRDGARQKAIDSDSEVTQLQQENLQLKRRIESITVADATSGGKVADVTAADGYILSTLSDDSLVYIDLARRDHVLPGMTFEVFAKNTLVKLNDFSELRGKATIEVIDVTPTSSLMRIIRKDKGVLVVDGDQIVNIVYDRNTEYRFFVHGRFDIDQIGQATDTDRDRVKSMIQQWRGKVTDSIDFRCDYVVLGQQPELPEPPAPGEIDIEVIKRYEDRLRVFNEYQVLIAEAKKLSIPIMNQNRFLTLVGYYRR